MKTTCIICKNEIIAPPSARRKYCSSSCYYISLQDSKITILLEQYRKTKCLCGCDLYLNPSRKSISESFYRKTKILYIHHHFSKTENHRKTHKLGKEHPMFGRKGKLSPVWKGGIKNRIDYGIGWELQRKKCRERDNYSCKRCGASKEERRIDVHHIIPFKTFNNYREANDLKNLLCLCYICHMKEEWKIRFTSKEGEFRGSPNGIILSQAE
jgi:hypothetical protein